MAYRRSRRVSRPPRRPSNRRMASTARRTRAPKAQTVRIVLETPATLARPMVPVVEAPRRARF